MPKYNFKCGDCLNLQSENMSIEQYSSIKNINYFCNKCGSKKINRIFKNTYSNIERNTEEIIAEIKEEVKSTVNKINSGDTSAISEIYGEEVNKLKVK